MHTQQAARAALVLFLALAAPGVSAQVSFEQATKDLASPDVAVRLRGVQLLKDAAYPEAAVPIARLITDTDDGVKFAAISAELNIFLAQKIVTKKRVGLIIEVRNKIAAEAAFSAGPSALGPRPVPLEVLMALRLSARDPNPRVAIEALYAFGTLAVTPAGNARRELLRTSGPDLAAMVGAADPAFRFAAVRVIDRVFARRPQDGPVDATVGDAVITVLNGNDRAMRLAAIRALGSMRHDRAAQSLADLYAYYGHGDLAEASLDALARIAHASNAPLFTAALAGTPAAIKGIAVEGLVRIGDRKALATIQMAVGADRNEGVALAGAFAEAVLGDGSLDPITEALSKPGSRDQARRYLIEIAPGRAIAFARYAQDPDARMRADVADILGLAGDPASIGVVEPLTKDRDPQVVLAAERAVGRLRAN